MAMTDMPLWSKVYLGKWSQIYINAGNTRFSQIEVGLVNRQNRTRQIRKRSGRRSACHQSAELIQITEDRRRRQPVDNRFFQFDLESIG